MFEATAMEEISEFSFARTIIIHEDGDKINIFLDEVPSKVKALILPGDSISSSAFIVKHFF